MLLRHATLRKNLPGIQRRGLLCARSLGKLEVVWLHAPGKTAWALLHTVRRHGGCRPRVQPSNSRRPTGHEAPTFDAFFRPLAISRAASENSRRMTSPCPSCAGAKRRGASGKSLNP